MEGQRPTSFKTFDVLRFLRVLRVSTLCGACAACRGADKGGNAGLANFKLLEVLTEVGQLEAFSGFKAFKGFTDFQGWLKTATYSSVEIVYRPKIDPLCALCEAYAACCGVDKGRNAGLDNFKAFGGADKGRPVLSFFEVLTLLRILRVSTGGSKLPHGSFETVRRPKIDPLCGAYAACCGADKGGNAGLANFTLLEVLTKAGQLEAF